MSNYNAKCERSGALEKIRKMKKKIGGKTKLDTYIQKTVCLERVEMHAICTVYPNAVSMDFHC